MTAKEKVILEDRLNYLDSDIEILLHEMRENNNYSHKTLNEYIRLVERRQELTDLIFNFGYWFKKMHKDGWEIDEESLD